MFNRNKKFSLKKLTAWIFMIFMFFVLYQTHSEWFSIVYLEKFVADYKLLVIILYVILLSVLGLFFIPSTPFALAGIILFSSTEVYFLNLIGILSSSTIVYFFARYLGFDEKLEEKYSKKLKKTKKALKNKELPIIAGWSFFPFVPTDIIIYAASSLKIPLWKCLAGVSIGEGTLNLIYLLSASALINT